MMEASRLLDTLRGLPGITALMLFDARDGHVIAEHVPSLLNGMPAESARRCIGTLYVELQRDGFPVRDLLFHYADHWIMTRYWDGLVLLVLAPQRTGHAAVRMASNLLVRHSSRAAFLTVQSGISACPVAADTAAEAPKRMYRGQTY